MRRHERTGGQRFGVLDGENERLLPGDGHDDRSQFDWDGVMIKMMINIIVSFGQRMILTMLWARRVSRARIPFLSLILKLRNPASPQSGPRRSFQNTIGCFRRRSVQSMS